MRLSSVQPLPAELEGVSRFALVAAAEGMEWEAEALDMSRPTSDGRMIIQDGLSIRPVPLALLYCPELGEYGHEGAVQVGTIQEASIDGSLVRMAGTWLDSPDPEVAAIIADVQQRTGTDAGLSVSVDLAVQKAVVTLVIPGEEEQEIEQAITEGEDVTVEIPVIDTETEVLRIDQCEVIGLTIVTQPAQDGLSIVNLSWENPEETMPVAASAEPDAVEQPEQDAPRPDHDVGLAAAIKALRDADLPRQIEAMALAVDKRLLTEDEARERLGYAKLNGQRVTADLDAITERVKKGEDVQGLVAETLAKLEQRQPPQVTEIHVPPAGSGARKVRVVKDDDGNVTGYESVEA